MSLKNPVSTYISQSIKGLDLSCDESNFSSHELQNLAQALESRFPGRPDLQAAAWDRNKGVLKLIYDWLSLHATAHLPWRNSTNRCLETIRLFKKLVYNFKEIEKNLEEV